MTGIKCCIQCEVGCWLSNESLVTEVLYDGGKDFWKQSYWLCGWFRVKNIKALFSIHYLWQKIKKWNCWCKSQGTKPSPCQWLTTRRAVVPLKMRWTVKISWIQDSNCSSSFQCCGLWKFKNSTSCLQWNCSRLNFQGIYCIEDFDTDGAYSLMLLERRKEFPNITIVFWFMYQFWKEQGQAVEGGKYINIDTDRNQLFILTN